MTNNCWLGSNELVIINRGTSSFVLERYEDYKEVFKGSYEKCREYVKQRYLSYMESIIG